MNCPHCGKENKHGDKYCSSCGKSLSKTEGINVQLPSQQAEEIIKNVHKLTKSFDRDEQIIGAGFLGSVITYFFQWFTDSSGGGSGFSNSSSYTGLLYLIPLGAIVSLLFLYFSLGSKKETKLFLNTIYGLIAAGFLGISLLLLSLRTGDFGLYLFIISVLAVLGGVISSQKNKLLK